MMFGPYASFVLGSYGIVAGVVAVLIAWVMIDHRRQMTLLRDLETSGITRRSARTRSEAS